jgi:hypothetical protein
MLRLKKSSLSETLVKKHPAERLTARQLASTSSAKVNEPAARTRASLK